MHHYAYNHNIFITFGREEIMLSDIKEFVEQQTKKKKNMR